MNYLLYVNQWISKFCFQWVLPFYFKKWNRYFSTIKQKFLESTSQFPSNFPSTSVPSNIPPLYFTFIKSSQLKCKFLGFLSAQVKICQISCVNFELTNQFLFKFCIIHHCHDKHFPCKLWAHKFSTLEKGFHQSSNFETFKHALVKIC